MPDYRDDQPNNEWNGTSDGRDYRIVNNYDIDEGPNIDFSGLFDDDDRDAETDGRGNNEENGEQRSRTSSPRKGMSFANSAENSRRLAERIRRREAENGESRSGDFR